MKSVVRFLVLALLIGLAASTAQAGWTRLADVAGQPSGKAVNGGGGITVLGDNVYLIVGANTPDFMKYSISGAAWSAITPGVPVAEKKRKQVKKGGYLVDDETDVYVFKGSSTNEFYKYVPATPAWVTLAEPGFTKGIKGGFAAFANYKGTPYIFAGSGSNLSEWKRYSIGTGLWETPVPAALPAEKVKIGSAFAFNGENILYFLLANTKTGNFFALDLSAVTPAWVAKADLPLTTPAGKNKKVKEGGSLDFLGGVLYAAKGGNTKEFWKYDQVGDAWTYVGEVGDGAATKGVKCGRSIAASTAGIYAIVGKNTNDFWYYTPAAFGPMAGSTVGAPAVAELAPNPVRGSARVHCAAARDGFARLTACDALGQTVLTATSSNGEFSLAGLQPGVYFCTVSLQDKVISTRLVVSR